MRSPIPSVTGTLRSFARCRPGARGFLSVIPTMTMPGTWCNRSRRAVPPLPAPNMATFVVWDGSIARTLVRRPGDVQRLERPAPPRRLPKETSSSEMRDLPLFHGAGDGGLQFVPFHRFDQVVHHAVSHQ